MKELSVIHLRKSSERIIMHARREVEVNEDDWGYPNANILSLSFLNTPFKKNTAEI